MNRQRVVRLLRIGWLVICCVPCLLLITLWVRSYSWSDLLGARISKTPIELISAEGRLKITRAKEMSAQYERRSSSFKTDQSQAHALAHHIRGFNNVWGIGIVRSRNPAILLPYWLLVVIVGVVSLAASRIRWSAQFSMRAMLVTMTLVAIASLLITWLL